MMMMITPLPDEKSDVVSGQKAEYAPRGAVAADSDGREHDSSWGVQFWHSFAHLPGQCWWQWPLLSDRTITSWTGGRTSHCRGDVLTVNGQAGVVRLCPVGNLTRIADLAIHKRCKNEPQGKCEPDVTIHRGPD